MDDDTNINPIWDQFLGDNTNGGVFRMMGLIIAFILIAGTCFDLLG